MIKKPMILILSLIGLAAIAVPAAKDAAVQSIWTAAPVKIDGIAQEWNDATPLFDKPSGAQYAVKNDGQDLYIIMVLRDAMARSTINYSGIKIYVTAGTKNSKDTGILFIQRQYTPEQLIASLEKKGETVTEEKKAEIRKQKTISVFLEEAASKGKGGTGAAGANPAVFRSVQKGQVAVYEFKIPFSRIGGQTAGAVQPGSTIKVGFEWGGMTAQIMRDMMAGRSDRSVSASDRGVSSDSGFRDAESGQEGGGGFGGMGGGVGELSRDPRYKKHAFWIDVALAAR